MGKRARERDHIDPMRVGQILGCLRPAQIVMQNYRALAVRDEDDAVEVLRIGDARHQLAHAILNALATRVRLGLGAGATGKAARDHAGRSVVMVDQIAGDVEHATRGIAHGTEDAQIGEQRHETGTARRIPDDFLKALPLEPVVDAVGKRITRLEKLV